MPALLPPPLAPHHSGFPFSLDLNVAVMAGTSTVTLADVRVEGRRRLKAGRSGCPPGSPPGVYHSSCVIWGLVWLAGFWLQAAQFSPN